ncbi:hypothetical protein D3C80_1766540 [compost metagenome]
MFSGVCRVPLIIDHPVQTAEFMVNNLVPQEFIGMSGIRKIFLIVGDDVCRRESPQNSGCGNTAFVGFFISLEFVIHFTIESTMGFIDTSRPEGKDVFVQFQGYFVF